MIATKRTNSKEGLDCENYRIFYKETILKILPNYVFVSSIVGYVFFTFVYYLLKVRIIGSIK